MAVDMAYGFPYPAVYHMLHSVCNAAVVCYTQHSNDTCRGVLVLECIQC